MSSENDESTELMMDELLMTPPIASANIRGLLPRRTLEPLLEEEYSDSCSSSSTQTEPSVSPDQVSMQNLYLSGSYKNTSALWAGQRNWRCC